MDGYGSDEQRAAYREALSVEKDGYEARVAQAKAIGDSDAVARYKSRIDQVDAEIARVDGSESAESDESVELSPAEKVAKAKTHADVDELADEYGYEFSSDKLTVNEKKAELEEHLA
jgi:cupin superfamily acireductone dioxygenase involved in methionine salvage